MTTNYAVPEVEKYEVIPVFEETGKSFQEAMEEILLMIIKQH